MLHQKHWEKRLFGESVTKRKSILASGFCWFCVILTQNDTRQKNWVLEANFKYFLTRENSRKSWDIELSNYGNKSIFQALAKFEFEKKNQNFWKNEQKNAFFLFHIYGSKMAKNDFFHETGFIQKFKVFWNFLVRERVFIRAFFLAVEAIEIFIFFENFEIQNFQNFQKIENFKCFYSQKK